MTTATKKKAEPATGPNNDQRVQQSLAELSEALKFPMGSLPLFVDPTNKMAAYTTPAGIWLSKAVVENDPANVKVYVAHEIFHWVVNDTALQRKYTHNTINIIADLKINELLLKLFDYDVRKVRLPGLLNPKLFGLSLDQIGQAVVKAQGSLKGHGTVGKQTHPGIAHCAMLLKKRYREHLDLPVDPFYLGSAEELAYVDVCKSVGFQYPSLPSLPGVDAVSVVKSFWWALYSPAPLKSAPKSCRTLTKEQAIVYSATYSQCRPYTRENSVEALWVADNLTSAINGDSTYLANQRYRAIAALTEAEGELEEEIEKGKRISKARMAAYNEAISLAKERVAKANALKPLSVLLEEQPVELMADPESTYRPRTLSTSLSASPKLLVPKVKVNVTVQRIRKLLGRWNSDLSRALSLAKQVEEGLADYQPPPEEEEEVEDDGDEGPISTNQEEVEDASNEDTLDPEAVQGERSEPDDVEEPKDETGPGDASKASGDSAGDDGEGPDDEQPDEDGGQQRLGGGDNGGDPDKGCGKSPGTNRTRVALFDGFRDNFKVMSEILSLSKVVDSMIEQIRSRNRRSTEVGVETSYEYGNDISRAVSSELAMLANEATKLEFLSRLASHQLLLTTAVEKKRMPVVLCLDESGSMKGQFYTCAAAFCLSMFKYLVRERRGVAFLMFSTNVTKEYVSDENDPLDLTKIVAYLASPVFGGTDFDAPLFRAQAIRDERKWRNVATFMVSDGDCSVVNTQLVAAQRKPEDKIIAALTDKNSVAGLRPVCDEMYQILKGGDGLQQIVNAATSLV